MKANEILNEEEIETVQMSRYHDGPRYWYHSLRGRELNAEGGIDSYPFPPSETVLAHEFRDWKEGDSVVYLAQTPLSSDALKIDITKLDTARNMRYTWQAEGYAIHRGTIPREAIVNNLNEMPFVSDLKRATATGKKYYHGSMEDLPVGTILTPGNDDYEENWGDNLWFQALEYWRPNEYLPHSMAVFMVDNEDDIDNAGGGTDYVFTVIPNGPVQRHDMNWMSEIGGILEDEGVDYGADEIKQLALNYWNGVPHPNESVWEYLTGEAVIVKTEPF